MLDRAISMSLFSSLLLHHLNAFHVDAGHLREVIHVFLDKVWLFFLNDWFDQRWSQDLRCVWPNDIVEVMTR